MAESRTALTELEGAVLTEIAHRGNHTSFRVRRAFEQSPSSSWSGSAGAVYPAIARLIRAGLIEAQPASSKRGTRLLSLTDTGHTALQRWFCDPDAACAIGADPFRLRAGLWNTLDDARRRDVIATMKTAMIAEMAKLDDRDDLDPVERTGNDLARALQSMRLAWLEQAERTT